MVGLCFICKKNVPGKAEIIKFSQNGFSISLFKDGLTCLECEKKEFAKKFDLYKYLFTYEDGKVVAVNWRSFCEEEKKRKQFEVVDLFVRLGVLSTSPVGNWEIVCDKHIPHNPKRFLNIAYFTKFEDVVDYAKIKYKQKQYNWQIRRIDTSFSKEEL
jgi:hypothetical protein